MSEINDQPYRRLFPRKIVTCNGVAVKKGRFVVDRGERFSEIKDHLVTPARNRVNCGETVVEIGTGWGVTATVLARQVGPDGAVHTYEAAREMAERASETLRLNEVANRVQIHNRPVAATKDVWGEPTTEPLPVSELPECDVLVLDCEGAECDILPALEQRPRMIIVESHEQFGCPSDEIVATLRGHNYSVKADRVANPEHDCRGLVAVTSGSMSGGESE
jgi:hypothetical protein